MRCEEVLMVLWEYLDEELASEEAVAVTGHLRDCCRCHPVYRCDRAFLELLARQRNKCSAPPTLVGSIRARLRLA